MRRGRHLALRAAAIAAASALAIVAAASVEPGGESPPSANAWPPSPYEGSPLPRDLRVPDVALVDEEGTPVRLAATRGPAVVMFGTAVCDESCPLTAQTVRGALDDLGEDVPAYVVAVDPAHDTPERARRFLAEQRVTGRLRFLVGPEEALRATWRGFAVAPQTAREHHQARIVLIEDGRQRVGWFAEQATPEALAHDLEVLRVTRRTAAAAAGFRGPGEG